MQRLQGTASIVAKRPSNNGSSPKRIDMNTKLLYMEDMGQLTCEAVVEKVEHKDGKAIVYLDQTVFYPQGGGQPYDTGFIDGKRSKLIVEEVRFVDGAVLHIGHFEGKDFNDGEAVSCKVDADRRRLHRR